MLRGTVPENISTKFKLLWNVSKISLKRFYNFFEVFLKIFKNFLKNYGKFLTFSLKFLRNFSKISLKYLPKYIKIFSQLSSNFHKLCLKFIRNFKIILWILHFCSFCKNLFHFLIFPCSSFQIIFLCRLIWLKFSSSSKIFSAFPSNFFNISWI